MTRLLALALLLLAGAAQAQQVPHPVNGPETPPAADFLAGWDGGLALKSMYNATTNSNLIGDLVVPQAGIPALGPIKLHVGSTNGNSAFVGATENNSPPATFQLSTGVTGYGKISAGSQGNQVFGMFGLAELFATSGTVIAAEFTARNWSGPTDISSTIPPDSSIGTTTRNAKGVNITCGAVALGDCTTGLHITNELDDYSKFSFTDAVLINNYRRFGVYIDAPPSGTQTGLNVKTNGNGLGVRIASTAEPVPGNAILSIVDSTAANVFSVTYNGSVRAKGVFIGGGTILMSNSVSYANGAGGAAGTLTNAPIAGNPTKWISIDDNGTVRKIPAW